MLLRMVSVLVWWMVCDVGVSDVAALLLPVLLLWFCAVLVDLVVVFNSVICSCCC